MIVTKGERICGGVACRYTPLVGDDGLQHLSEEMRSHIRVIVCDELFDMICPLVFKATIYHNLVDSIITVWTIDDNLGTICTNNNRIEFYSNRSGFIYFDYCDPAVFDRLVDLVHEYMSEPSTHLCIGLPR